MRHYLVAILPLMFSCGETSDPAGSGGGVGDDVFITEDVSGGDQDVPPTPDTVTEPTCKEGSSCTDGDPCTSSDQCKNGVCAGEEYSCNDGRDCTDDVCDALGGCIFTIKDGNCLIFNTCLQHGDANPSNTCEVCDIDASKISWTTAAELTPCEDGNPCTYGDSCNQKGQCKKGIKLSCDDNNECTLDDCDAGIGCINQPVSGSCDDGDPCTSNSFCTGGLCMAPFSECDDNNPCTVDTCLPTQGCDHQQFSGPCDDGDACTDIDACIDGQCQSGAPTNCNDGTECTDDHCDSDFGCYYTLVADPCCTGAVHLCDDGNPCTTDACTSGQGDCTHEANNAVCNDGNPCTIGDLCFAKDCVPGLPNPCDDGNQCTVDSCNPAVGCQHAGAPGVPCNDGIECTTEDTCQGSLCVGNMDGCQCTPVFSSIVAKVTLLLLGENGKPGNGMNVDQKNSCAPADKCSNDIDNSLAPLSGFVNSNLEEEVLGGGLNLLFELKEPKTDGTPFTVAIYASDKADDACNHLEPGCEYIVEKEVIGEDCEPLITLDNATIINGKIKAGGPGYNFTLFVPLFGDTLLPVILYYGSIEGDIDLNGEGGVTVTNGLVGGAIPKSVFANILDYVPPEDLPAPKESIIQLLEVLITNDIDTDGNGQPDAASVGFIAEAVSGIIAGVDD